ncbi:MAG: hypothetical protein BGO12_19050 [Verrucomicrobia bacterium 61-8]|nr:GHKL domain-containing protein [Verrucomicrobiota bacterium]OJV00855.1 MAG: hypothetical protein BGO12_19050 [Verrucomicrobia bacterium 61-8]
MSLPGNIQNPPPVTQPRSDDESIRRQVLLISEASEVRTFLDAIPDIFLVVNSARQIVFANKSAFGFFGVSDPVELWGRRPGEAARCIHSNEAPGGCGESCSCQVCGAFQAICGGLAGCSPVEECRLLSLDGRPYDLRVWAQPFVLAGESFAILSIQDISDEKRRQVLEKIFFHDILNTAGGLHSVGEIMGVSAPEEMTELGGLVSQLSSQLLDEIHAQRQMLSAERGDLPVRMAPVRSGPLIDRLITTYRKNPVSNDRLIECAAPCDDVEFTTDPALLNRVLGNLLKNALEASRPGHRIEIGCHSDATGEIEFFVQNPGIIPESDQLQIFQRSFSTKGYGRGIGAYSVKLLTERYLQGRVGFTSNSGDQTRFFVRLPLEPSAQLCGV